MNDAAERLRLWIGALATTSHQADLLADVDQALDAEYRVGWNHGRKDAVERIRAALAEVDPNRKGEAIPAILDAEADR